MVTPRKRESGIHDAISFLLEKETNNSLQRIPVKVNMKVVQHG